MKYVLYADDTTISVHDRSMGALVERAAEAESAAVQWFRSNGLTLNEEKTVRMVFSLCRSRDCGDLDVENCVKFLGVCLDPTLSWGSHIDALASKLSSNIYLLRNLSNSLSPAVLKTAYFALCHSLLSYAILSWGQASGWNRVFALQRRAVRLICGLNYREDCRDSFIQLRILTFPCVYIYEALVYARSNLDALSINQVQHNYLTRHRNDIRLPQIRLTKSQKTVNYLCIKYFNRLPESIKLLCIPKFEREIKNILLTNAFYSYKEFLDYDF